MISQPDISVIVPFLNEECSLPRLSQELMLLAQSNESLNFEIILVNDGSCDESKKIILQNRFPEGTKLISLSRNFGSHAALRAGISRATGQFITFLYADLQDPVENVMLLYRKIICGSKNIAWAFRNVSHNGFFEKKFSGLYSGLMRRFVNRQYPGQGFDVVMFDTKVAAELNKNVETNSSIFLQILNMGFTSDFILYDKSRRTTGKSKWTFSKRIKLLIDSFVGFSFAPIRLVSIIGITFFFFGICWACYIIFRKLVFNDLAYGWPALLCVLLVGFGITNISLGIIAEYLWRTLDSTRKRPVFIINDVLHL